MIHRVIKKSGKKQKFDEKKIKKCINNVCREVKLEKNKVKKKEDAILKEVLKIAKKREITTAEIRDIILKDLSQVDPAVARAWFAFEIFKIQGKKDKTYF